MDPDVKPLTENQDEAINQAELDQDVEAVGAVVSADALAKLEEQSRAAETMAMMEEARLAQMTELFEEEMDNEPMAPGEDTGMDALSLPDVGLAF